MSSTPEDDLPLGGRGAGRVGLAVAALYALVAVATHHFGPFYVFDMYAFAAPATTSRLILVDGEGRAVDVRSVDAIRCEGDVRAALAAGVGRCVGVYSVDARDDEVYDVLAGRLLAPVAATTAVDGDGAAMTLVRRAYRWPDGRVRGADCAAVACTVRR